MMLRRIAAIDSTVVFALYLIPSLVWVLCLSIVGTDFLNLRSGLKDDYEVKNYVAVDHEINEKEDASKKGKRSENLKTAESLSSRLLSKPRLSKNEATEANEVVEEADPVEQKEIIKQQPKQKVVYIEKRSEPSQKPVKGPKSNDPEAAYRSFSLDLTDADQSEPDPVIEGIRLQKVKGQFAETKRFVVGRDKMIYIRNLESFRLPGVTVPRNTIMMAEVSATRNRIEMHINSVEVNGKVYSTNIAIGDESGSGQLIAQDVDELMNESQDELDRMLEGAANSASVNLPMNLGSVTIPTRRRDNKLEILFDNKTKVLLTINPQ